MIHSMLQVQPSWMRGGPSPTPRVDAAGGLVPAAAGGQGPTRRGAREFVTLLVSFPKILRTYSEHHARVTAHVASLLEHMRALVDAGRGRFAVVADGEQLLLDDIETLVASKVDERLALLLRHRGVKALVFRMGAGENEVRAAGELLKADAKAVLAAGGAPAFLAGHAHECMEVVTFGGGGEQAVAAAEIDGRTLRAQSGAPSDASLAPGRMERLAEGRSSTIGLEILSGARGSALAGDAPCCPADPRGFAKPTEGAGTGAEAAPRVVHAPQPPAPHAAFDDEREAVAYDRCEIGGDGPGGGGLLPLANDAIRKAHDDYRPDRTALLVLAQLLFDASDRAQYDTRRQALLEAMESGRFPAHAHLAAMRQLQAHADGLPFGDGNALTRELLGRAGDEETITGYLASGDAGREGARGLVANLVRRKDAFTMLARLLRAPLPPHAATPVAETFVRMADERPSELGAWAVENDQDFLQPEVVSLLCARAYAALGPIAKVILTGTSDDARRKLVELLVQEGTTRALHLLALGLTYGTEARSADLIAAFGKFSDPLAVAVLREVIHRCNTMRTRELEARAAVAALRESECDEARAFLREIRDRRHGLLPAYRRALRALASDALGEGISG